VKVTAAPAETSPPGQAARGAQSDRQTSPRDATSYTFDGFKLGDLYGSTVMKRPPYDQPCDNDPIDNRSRRFMVYGALPCRDRTFPEGTTVAFYLRHEPAGGDEYDQPIIAFAWLGGGYFSTRSDFPVHTGQPAAAAADALGAPLSSFEVSRKRETITVQRHPGDVYSLIDSGTLVGFAIGPMPDDPENEQWRGLMQMYTRYTKARKAGE
jgi:hypothetical protein